MNVSRGWSLVKSYHDIGGFPLVLKAIGSKLQTETVGYPNTGKEMSVTFSGQEYRVSTEYPSAERWTKTARGVDEPAAKRVLKESLVEDSCFLDVGAQCGDTALFVHSLVGEKGDIHAFEPTTYWYNILEENIETNKIENISAHNTAVGAEQGSLPPEAIVGGGHELMEETLEQTTVDVVTIDDYVDGKDVSPDVIQIDVDGAEHQVLKGGRETIQGTKTILELHHEEMLEEWEEVVELALELSNVYYLSGQGLTPSRYPFGTEISSSDELNKKEVSFLLLEP